MSDFHFKVSVPEDFVAPVEFYEDNGAYSIGVVHKERVGKLPVSWDLPATYLLVGDRDPQGGWDVYVGKAPSGVKGRLKQHAKAKENWSRALIVIRKTVHGLNSAQIGWLEGRLHEIITADYPDARIMNTVQPGDKTLPTQDHPEAAVAVVKHCLRALGYPEREPVAQKRSAAKAKSPTPIAGKVQLADIVSAGIIPAGTIVHSSNGKWPGTAVIQTDGKLILDGISFDSPSAAGVYLRRGMATNGWTFWIVQQEKGTQKSLAQYRDEWRPSTPRSIMDEERPQP